MGRDDLARAPGVLAGRVPGRRPRYRREPGVFRVVGHGGQHRAVPAGPSGARDRGRHPRHAGPGVRAVGGRRADPDPPDGQAPPGGLRRRRSSLSTGTSPGSS